MTWLWGLLAQAEPESWIAWLEDAGTKGALIGVIYMLGTRRWITRGTYDEMKEDRDHWRSLCLGNKHIAANAVDVVKERT